MYKSILLIALVSMAAAVDNWAVIAAGASGFFDYAAQSTTCRVYQLLRRKGIPADHIIHIARDDVAYDEENPVKGKLFAQKNGPDVYEGCVFDYPGDKTNVDTYYAVLTGDSDAVQGGKVLKSTKDSNVFLYHIGHGGPGVI